MLKEVLIVEGKMDVLAVRRAVDADCMITGGFNLLPKTMTNIEQAYKKRGIIIFTDPDPAGEKIRRYLTRRFPEAKHAFVPVEEATAKGDIGIEQASPEAIRRALSQVKTAQLVPSTEFSAADLVRCGLSGGENASARRAGAGALLGLGFANAKTFLKRLNSYGVTREAFEAAVRALDDAETGGNNA